MKKQAFVSVPGSSGNIGPGFDVLGLALTLRNEMRVKILSPKSGKPIFHIEGEGADIFPKDDRNFIFRSAQVIFRKAGKKVPAMEFRCLNRIPPARGLGSSAAACLSGLLAANQILGNPFSKDEILILASDIEGHPDNVAPILLGGIRASGKFNGKIWSFKWPAPRARLVMAVPDFKLSTRTSRSVLPKKVPLEDAVFNMSAVCVMPDAFRSRLDLLKFIFNDRLHEPYRAKLVRGFHMVKRNALKAGAYGVTLSGSGPSILAFANPRYAGKIGKAMGKGFRSVGVKCRILNLSVDDKGAIVK